MCFLRCSPALPAKASINLGLSITAERVHRRTSFLREKIPSIVEMEFHPIERVLNTTSPQMVAVICGDKITCIFSRLLEGITTAKAKFSLPHINLGIGARRFGCIENNIDVGIAANLNIMPNQLGMQCRMGAAHAFGFNETIWRVYRSF